MFVSFLTRSLEVGGAQRQVVTLAIGLQGRGHYTNVYTFSGGPLEAELRRAGVEVHNLEKGGRWDLVRVSQRLASALRKERPDVLHAYLSVPNLVAVALKPFLRETRVVMGIRTAKYLPADRFGRSAYALQRWASRQADLVIVNSQAAREDLIGSGFPEGKTTVIPNGVEMQRFRPDTASRLAARSEWGVDSGLPVIGMVARLEPLKNHSAFLAAARLLLDRRGDLWFVCVGEGAESDVRALRSASRRLGLDHRLKWVGSCTDMTAAYNAMDLLVLCSSAEGFPNVVAEAMACGVPCVVTDVGDAALIVGDTGVVVPTAEPDRLAAACADLLQRLDSARGDDLRLRARNRIEQSFSSERLVSRTLLALESVL